MRSVRIRAGGYGGQAGGGGELARNIPCEFLDL